MAPHPTHSRRAFSPPPRLSVCGRFVADAGEEVRAGRLRLPAIPIHAAMERTASRWRILARRQTEKECRKPTRRGTRSLRHRNPTRRDSALVHAALHSCVLLVESGLGMHRNDPVWDVGKSPLHSRTTRKPHQSRTDPAPVRCATRGANSPVRKGGRLNCRLQRG